MGEMVASRLIASVLLFVTLLAAGPSPAPIVVRVGLVPNDDAATPLLYAQRAGLFAKAGIDLQLALQTSGSAVTAAVVAGTYDIGKSSIVPLINAHQHDLPITIVAPAAIWNGKSPFAALLVRADSPVRTGKDLEGKLIGVQSLNDMNQVATDAWVGQHGGDPATLRFVEIPMTAGAAALKNGRIDAAAFVEPVLDDALADGQLRALPGAYEAIAPQYLFAAWFSTKSWVRDHPDTARQFARILADAARYTNAHHHETAALVAQFTSIPLPVIEHMTRTPSGTVLDPEQLQPIIDAAVKYKVLAHGFPATEMIGAGN
jgi:NitT/TauT family transport system substrate-binding protein